MIKILGKEKKARIFSSKDSENDALIFVKYKYIFACPHMCEWITLLIFLSLVVDGTHNITHDYKFY